MATLRRHKRLLDAYRVAGFHPQEEVRGLFGDSMARVVTFVRRSKKLSARSVVERTLVGTTARHEPIEKTQLLCGHEDKTTTEMYIKQRWRETAAPNMVEMAV